MASLDVVGLGYCCIDDLLLLSEIPPAEGRAVVRQRGRQGGGMVATAMVAVARLGGRAGFVSAVGDDERGAWILNDFRGHGVDVSRAVVRTGATSHLTVVLVDSRTGQRSFLSDRGNVSDVGVEELPREYLTSAKLLHLSDASPAALQAAQWAKEAGMEVCFDGTHFHPSVWQLLPQLDYLIVSRFFASEFAAHRRGAGLSREALQFAQLSKLPTTSSQHVLSLHPQGEPVPEITGEALLDVTRELRAEGPSTVVVTEGELGSWCASAEGDFHTPAFPVEQVVDTTGAGDVFHGAFLFGRAQGWDLRRSLRVASATASLKCRALGGRAGIPTLDAVLALL
jgi:sulfofructose kinase